MDILRLRFFNYSYHEFVVSAIVKIWDLPSDIRKLIAFDREVDIRVISDKKLMFSLILVRC